MKILFVRPNQLGNRSIPIGMTVLQACIKKAGHQVRIFDTTFMSENVKNVGSNLESLGFFKPTDTSKFIHITECNIKNELIKEFSIKLFNISKGEKWRLNPMKYIPPRKCRSFLR